MHPQHRSYVWPSDPPCDCDSGLRRAAAPVCRVQGEKKTRRGRTRSSRAGRGGISREPPPPPLQTADLNEDLQQRCPPGLRSHRLEDDTWQEESCGTASSRPAEEAYCVAAKDPC